METVSAESSLFADQRRGRLLRVLGFGFGLAVTIGGVIGMGILRTPGEIAAELPRTWLFIGVWLVGGLYALLGTISVAELGAMIPRSGGFYIFARHTFGPYAGFVIGWSDWLSTCGTTAAVALVIGEYTTALFPALEGRDVQVAVFATVAFAILQWRGVLWGGRTQEITSSLKALAFLALIAACFILGNKSSAVTGNVAQSAQTNALVSFALFSGIIKALQGVIYTYDGWYNLIYFGEEVREPERNIARSMIGSVVLVIAIYVLVNLALLYVLPLSEIAGQKLAVGAAANAIFGDYGGKIIAALATISMLSTVNANNLIAPRILFAMSRDRLFSEKAVKVNRGGTPTVTLFVSTLVAVLFIVLSERLEKVFAVLAFFFVINYGITFLSVFVLRRREPERPRPFRAWGYPWTTGLVLLGSIAFLVGAFLDDPQDGIYVLVLLAASYPAFLLLRLIHKKV
ncbi:MAG TPA: APC family permease [Pyrinomonadaceae bacterium]|nr:APC family permease [Pyrinomonadaceae bacterium]